MKYELFDHDTLGRWALSDAAAAAKLAQRLSGEVLYTEQEVERLLDDEAMRVRDDLLLGIKQELREVMDDEEKWDFTRIALFLDEGC